MNFNAPGEGFAQAIQSEQNSSINPRTPGERKFLGLKDDEIDPVDSVIELLREAGHRRPEAWAQSLDPIVLDKSYPKLLRRTKVNQKLIEVLGLAEENTMDQRAVLVDTGPLSVWLLLINQSVVPMMVRLDLPNSRF